MGVAPILVPPSELRARFAAGRVLARADAGEFTCCLKDESIARSRDEPSGTRSLVVGYLNARGHRVVLVHLYLRPGQPGATPEIGASGQPDPKWLCEDGVVYASMG